MAKDGFARKQIKLLKQRVASLEDQVSDLEELVEDQGGEDSVSDDFGALLINDDGDVLLKDATSKLNWKLPDG